MLVAISKGMQAVELCCNKILQVITCGVCYRLGYTMAIKWLFICVTLYHLSKVALEGAVLGEDVRKQWLITEVGRRNRETCPEVLAILGKRYDNGVISEVLYHTHTITASVSATSQH